MTATFFINNFICFPVELALFNDLIWLIFASKGKQFIFFGSLKGHYFFF